MSIAIGGAWAMLAVLWYSAALPVPALFGGSADALLLIVLVWACVRRPEEAIAIALVGGFATDLLSDQPLGITVLALLPAALAGGLRSARMLDTDWVSSMILAAGATLAYHVILLALLTAAGNGPPIGEALREEALPASLTNALLAPIIHLIIWLGSFDIRAERRQLPTG